MRNMVNPVYVNRRLRQITSQVRHINNITDHEIQRNQLLQKMKVNKLIDFQTCEVMSELRIFECQLDYAKHIFKRHESFF